MSVLTPLQAIILGIVQGLTEFAPVSSSAHLVIVPWALGWPSPGLAFDTILHLGTLLAVILVFGADLWRLAVAWIASLRPPFRMSTYREGTDARTAWLLLVATVPGAVLGYAFKDTFEELFGRPLVVGLFLLGTALILVCADLLGRKKIDQPPQGIWQALAIGMAQAVAIAPGISRSGATISTAMLLGHTRTAAARFSFLLSIPIIMGAGVNQTLKLIKSTEPMDYLVVGIGFAAAAISGYLCIRFLLSYFANHGLRVFAGYCAVVGTIVVAVNVFMLR